MTLAIGTRLGTYEIVAMIGAGGMGEVYRASDSELNRDVAIKILRPDVAGDVDRLARFRREAHVLASLNHPNIGAIYGLADNGSLRALVLELVEGPTLADRVARGPVALEEALPIARQIAEALEAAHDRGVIHRDLKPANIKIRPDGTVKVLDFGLAKALVPPASSGADAETIGATDAGIILGTAAYMSPEQAKGHAVDRRTDLWAFGAVLYEMLAGRPPFTGANTSDMLVSVLRDDPDWTRVPAETPAPIRRLLRRCLEKDGKRRLDSATAARLEIDEALTSSTSPADRDGFAPHPTWKRPLPWVLAGALALGIAFMAVSRESARSTPPAKPLRLSAELGADVAALPQDRAPSAILSPDGDTLAFVAETRAGASFLYIRPLDELTAAPLRGTDRARDPFFSPDGKWIAFFADEKLKKISVSGGTPVTVCDVTSARGGSWAENGFIVFAANTERDRVLMRVSSEGGLPTPVTTLRDGEIAHRWPQMLPGDAAVLYTSSRSDNWGDATLVVQPLPSGLPHVVHRGGFHGRYVSSGHLVYVKDGTLYAVPFDLARFQLTGRAVAAVQGVTADTSTGGAQFAISQTGTAVLLQGQGSSDEVPIAWMDGAGTTTPLRATRANWSNPRFSPDGGNLAIDIADNRQVDIWIEDLGRHRLSRLTFEAANDEKPVWTPDGRRIAFTSNRDGARNLYWQRADGTGEVQRLTRSPNAQSAASWHPGGRFLAFQEGRPQTGSDLMILPLNGDEASGWTPGEPIVFASGAFNEAEPVFSPDGRWLAYHSNESGRAQVFVRPFPGGSGKWQISTEGGRDASWSRTRPELLFFGFIQNRVMIASYSVAGNSFRAETARAWSETHVGRPPRGSRTFDLHPAGDRVVIVPTDAQKPDHVTLVFNFLDELRRIAPVTNP